MDFFEVIISASFDKMLPPVCKLERQQGDAHYYYHSSGIKAATPNSAIINKFNQSLSINAIMIGAALIDRQFDAICRCNPYNQDNPPLTSSYRSWTKPAG